jgi:hypothetical protein
MQTSSRQRRQPSAGQRSYQKGASKLTALAGEGVAGIRVTVAGIEKKEGADRLPACCHTLKGKSATLKTETRDD